MSSPFFAQPNQLSNKSYIQLIWDQTANQNSGAFRPLSNTDIGGQNASSTTIANSGLSGLNSIVSGVLLQANPSRISFFVQNNSPSGASAAVKYGTGTVNFSNYNVLLAPAASAGGAGGSVLDYSWKGPISVYGSGAYISYLELQP